MGYVESPKTWIEMSSGPKSDPEWLCDIVSVSFPRWTLFLKVSLYEFSKVLVQPPCLEKRRDAKTCLF